MNQYLDPRWQKLRALVHIRDNWACCDCGSTTDTLHAHHLWYDGAVWNVPLEALVTVCDACHAKRHEKAEPPTRQPEKRIPDECLDAPGLAEQLERRSMIAEARANSRLLLTKAKIAEADGDNDTRKELILAAFRESVRADELMREEAACHAKR